MFFEEYMNFKFFSYFRRCGAVTVENSVSHISPPAIRIRVKSVVYLSRLGCQAIGCSR